MELMKVVEVAALLGISTNATYKMIEDRRIPSVRIGKRSVRVPRAAWDEWMAKNTKDALAAVGGQTHDQAA